MPRPSGLIGFRTATIAIMGMMLITSTGALSSYWLSRDPPPARADSRGVVTARLDPTAASLIDCDGDEMDPTADDFGMSTDTLDELIRAANTMMGEADAMPDAEDAGAADTEEDWLLDHAALLGIADAWNAPNQRGVRSDAAPPSP